MIYNISNWKFFQIKDIFTIRGTRNSKQKQISGKIRVLGQGEVNNGVIGYGDEFTEKGNVIVMETVARGKAFWNDENFTLNPGRSSAVIINKNLNRYSAIFIISLLEKNMDLYGYGYKRSMDRLKKETIKLPIKEDGLVDWEFMENQGKLAENEAIKNSPLYEKIKIIIDQENKK
jgi:hypothetical protein